jgi:hypothetical protein
LVFHSTSRINPAAAAFAAHLLWDLGIGNFAKSIAHRSSIEGGVSELVIIAAPPGPVFPVPQKHLMIA